MKPKQPDFAAFYDHLGIYQESGTRDSTGGFSGTYSLVRSIWGDVSLQVQKDSYTNEGVRMFKRGIKVKCYKDELNESDLIQYNGQMYYVDNVDTSNQAFDIAYGSTME